MTKYVSRGLALVLFTGGLTLLGAGIANAADTTGDDGLLSGTQIAAPITAPVEAAGNAVSVLGDAFAGGTAAPAPAPAPASAPVTTSGTDSVLGGTQAVVEAAAPVTVQGNAISVVGDAASAPAPVAAAPAAEPAAPAAAPTTSGSDGIAGGTQVLPNISVPVNLGGNAVSVLGDSSSEGASAPAAAPTAGSTGSTDGATTTGSDSVAGGTQIAPDVALPVSVGGNAISILGDAASTGSSTPAAQEGTNDGVTTTGNDGILGGTQIVPSIALPISIGGNAISVLGDTEVVPGDGTTGVDGLPDNPTDPATPTGPTDGTDATNGSGGTIVVDGGLSATGTTAAFGSGLSATAGLSVQALASTGAEIAPLVGLIGLLLAVGLALLVIGRRRAV